MLNTLWWKIHTTELLKWSTLSKFYRSRGAQVISLVPLLGYFILWSDSLAPLLEYTKNLGTPGYLAPISRLYFLYFGSLFVLVGWVAWAWRCPDIVKRFENREIFVNRCITSSDAGYLRWSALTLIKYIATAKAWPKSEYPRVMYDDEEDRGQWPQAPYVVIEQLVHGIRTHNRNEEKSTGLVYYYNFVDFGRYKARFTTALTAVTGMVLFVIPSIEVFVLVLMSVARKLV